MGKRLDTEFPAGKEADNEAGKTGRGKADSRRKDYNLYGKLYRRAIGVNADGYGGVSAVFKGSIVTYSNEAKVAAGVSPFIIQEYGVYSAQCAREMAAAAQETYCADIAVGITGTTGNTDRENAGSRAGEAYYCIIDGGDIHDYRIRAQVAGMTRREIKELYAAEVYEKLLEML